MSATVVVSEAMALLCPQGTATRRGLAGTAVADSPIKFVEPNMPNLPKTQPYCPTGRVFLSKKELTDRWMLSRFHLLSVLRTSFYLVRVYTDIFTIIQKESKRNSRNANAGNFWMPSACAPITPRY